MSSKPSISSGALLAEISLHYLPLPSELPREDWESCLAGHIQILLDTDFHRLVSLLYRVDVDEKKLKKILSENPETDAANLIARLLLERVEEKMLTRRKFSHPAPDTDTEERW